MTAAVQDLLAAFDALTPAEQHELAVEILRRSMGGKSGRPDRCLRDIIRWKKVAPNQDDDAMSQVIINRGRGPEIAGTRITVYDVLDYSTKGYHPTIIASLFRVSSQQVEAALEYIDAHKDEVMAEYRQMLARAAAGNPPEVQAKEAASRAKLLARLAELRQARRDRAALRPVIAKSDSTNCALFQGKSLFFLLTPSASDSNTGSDQSA